MYVTPEIVTTKATASVVYTSAGPGHYDAALPTNVAVASIKQLLGDKPVSPVQYMQVGV